MRRAKLDVKSQKANIGRYEGVGGVIGWNSRALCSQSQTGQHGTSVRARARSLFRTRTVPIQLRQSLARSTDTPANQIKRVLDASNAVLMLLFFVALPSNEAVKSAAIIN